MSREYGKANRSQECRARPATFALGVLAFLPPETALANEGVCGSVSITVPVDKSAEITSSGPLGGKVALEDVYSREIAVGYRAVYGEDRSFRSLAISSSQFTLPILMKSCLR